MTSESSLDSSDKFLLSQRGYTIHRQIGEGSYSKVYSVTYIGKETSAQGSDFKTVENEMKNVKLNLACKLIKSDKMPKDFVTKFLNRELNILSKVSHPHIIHVHSILQRGLKFLIFMRNAEYGNLCDFLITHGAVRERVARLWTRQLCIALIYLHTLDIAHRDIKCENILITSNHNVKLADFGFSRFSIDMKGKPLFCSTYCGSLPYASPELLKGVPYNPKLTDIWSLGVVLFIMLNRVMPFKSENLTDLWFSQMNKNYKFKQQVLDSVSPEVVTIVSLMLEPNSLERIPLEDILKSKWMAADPKLTELTEIEKLAMVRAFEAKEDIRPYKVKKINLQNANMKVIAKEAQATTSEKVLAAIAINKMDDTDNIKTERLTSKEQ